LEPAAELGFSAEFAEAAASIAIGPSSEVSTLVTVAIDATNEGGV
jgi:hypothetical protein